MKGLLVIALGALISAMAALLPIAPGVASTPHVNFGAPTVVTAPTAEPRPFVFSDDFETFGDLSQWDGGGNTLHVQQEVVHGGAYAARGTSTGSLPAYARKRLSGSYPELYYRLRFNIIDQGENPLTLLAFGTASGASILTVTVDRTGLLAFDNVAAGKIIESTTVVTRGTWHEIQVHARIGGSPGRVEVWLDDTTVGALSSTGWLGRNPIGQIQLGDNTSGHVYDVAFDDIAVDTVAIPSTRAADPARGTLTVRAIPPWSGMQFTLDGQTFVTDQQGVARIDVNRWSPNLRERITIAPAVGADGGHAVFTGWFNWTGVRDRDVNAAFNVSYPVSWIFGDLQGHPIDPQLVTSLTVKSSTGVVAIFRGDQLRKSQLLVASSIVPAPGGRHAKPLTWRVESVIVHGSNVVHESQQQFTVRPIGKPWQIRLLFYAAHFTARDAFFGFPLGSAIKLEYPDGDMGVTPLDGKAEATLPSLPRGEYRVSVTGAGYSPPRPLALSRDAEVQLEVVSRLDIGVAGLMAGGTALVLLFIGRPRLLAPLGALNPRRLAGRRQRAAATAELEVAGAQSESRAPTGHHDRRMPT